MKLRVSISVAAFVLAVVCFGFFVSPQRFLYEWALGKVLPDANFHLDWINGVAQVEGLRCSWPAQEIENDWKTQYALYLLKGQPVAFNEAVVSLEGKEYQLSGYYGEDRTSLILSLDNKEVISLKKDDGPYLFSFNEAPLNMWNAFLPTGSSLLSGTLSKGYIDENRRGNVEVSNLSYTQNEFTLTSPKAYVELNGSVAKVLGVDVSLVHNNELLWTLNPLPMELSLEGKMPFHVNAASTIQFVDERCHLGTYLKNLKVEGSLQPGNVDLFSFSKSILRPLDESSPFQSNHMAACEYKSNQPSYFTLLGEEVCCECNLDKEKTFSVEFSEPFLEKYGVDGIPITRLKGGFEKENGLWHVFGQIEKGKLDAYLSSLLLPQTSLKEAYLTLSEWSLKEGHTLKDVSLHFNPEKTVWKANLEGITFHGSGLFNKEIDICFNATGTCEEWKKVLGLFAPKNPLMNCPLTGTCTIRNGSLSGEHLVFEGQIEGGAIGAVNNIRSKFHYENGCFGLKDLTANADYKGKTLSIVAPQVTLDESIEFDGWISDQSQDYVRLAGNGVFLGKEILVEFDPAKTHLFNMVPTQFSLALKNWTSVDRLVFRGKGANHAPCFDDLNRWTENADWKIALHYEQDGQNNQFKISKGPLSLKGTMQNLAQYRIEDLSLNTAMLTLGGSGVLDLNKMLVHLDPVEIDVKFNDGLTQMPIHGNFSAVGIAVASLNSTESWLEVKPQGLSLGLLSMPNTPFHLHQKGEDFVFHCDYLVNHNLMSGFDCLLNRSGLKAKNSTTSFYIGATHFGIDRAGMTIRGRHYPTFALTEPLKADLEIVKAFLPFNLDQVQGGSIYLNMNHCSITDTTLLGKEIDQIEFDFEEPVNQDLLLKNIAFKNEGESLAIQVATLSYDKGQLKKVSCPSIIANNVSFSPVLIKNISMANFESTAPFKEFTGRGKLSFSNLLPLLTKHLNVEELSELSAIDAKWFLPNQGEFTFEARKDQLMINELKECFSSGKMIRFELNSDVAQASVLWDGTLELPLKLKPQHLSFKWSELFALKLEGSLLSPHLEMKKK